MMLPAAMAIGFVFLWNSGFIGAELGLPNSGPFTLLFWRYAALTGLLAIAVLVLRRGQRLERTALLRIAGIGVLSHGVWLGCVLVSLDRGVPAGIVALVVALQPLATGALSGLITGEATGLRQWFGLSLGFVGVAIAVGARMGHAGSATVLGHLIPFGSVAAITIASLVQRRVDLDERQPRVPLDIQLLIQAAATTLAVAAPAIFWEALQTRWSSSYVVTMMWLVVAVSLGAYALMWLLLSRTDATRVSSLFYLGPPVTMLMAWFTFGDTLFVSDLVGLGVVACGVAIVMLRWPGKRLFGVLSG